MRAAAFAIVLAAVLVLAPAASAKGSVPSRVCGESACVAIANDPDLMVTLYSDAARPQPARLPYYRLDYHRAPGIPSRYFVPARNLVGQTHAGGRWFRLEGPALAAIEAAIRGLEPFPAPGSWAAPHDETTELTLPAALVLGALGAGAILMLRFGRVSLGET